MTSVYAAAGTTLIMFTLKYTIGIRVSEEDEVRSLCALTSLPCTLVVLRVRSCRSNVKAVLTRTPDVCAGAGSGHFRAWNPRVTSGRSKQASCPPGARNQPPGGYPLSIRCVICLCATDAAKLCATGAAEPAKRQRLNMKQNMAWSQCPRQEAVCGEHADTFVEFQSREE